MQTEQSKSAFTLHNLTLLVEIIQPFRQDPAWTAFTPIIQSNQLDECQFITENSKDVKKDIANTNAVRQTVSPHQKKMT